jgi:hypothetical protein
MAASAFLRAARDTDCVVSGPRTLSGAGGKRVDHAQAGDVLEIFFVPRHTGRSQIGAIQNCVQISFSASSAPARGFPCGCFQCSNGWVHLVIVLAKLCSEGGQAVRGESGRGLPHSKTLRAIRRPPERAPAFWSAAVLRRFSVRPKPRTTSRCAPAVVPTDLTTTRCLTADGGGCKVT